MYRQKFQGNEIGKKSNFISIAQRFFEMMRVVLLAVCALVHAAYAYRVPTLVAPHTAVRNHRTASLSMVMWDHVPADTLWTKQAWEAMGLNSANLHACVSIPDELVPIFQLHSHEF